MKKTFIYLIISALLLMPMTTFAKGTNSAPLTLGESTKNMQKLDSYGTNEQIKGSFDFTGEEDLSVKGNFTANIISDVINKGKNVYNLKSSIKIAGDVTVAGKNKPFDKANMEMRMDMKMLNGKDIYIKINNINISATGIEKESAQDYEDMQTELKKGLSQLRGKWFYISLDKYQKLNKSNSAQLNGLFDSKKIEAKLQKGEFNEAIEEIVNGVFDNFVKEKMMTKAEALKAKILVAKFIEKGMFTKKILQGGDCDGCVNYTLNKPEVINFITSMSGILGGGIPDDSMKQIKDALGKINISDTFKENTDLNIFDSSKMSIDIKDMKPLNNLSIGIIEKISPSKKIRPITAPAKYFTEDALQNIF